jgi:glycosyltransferase involved in cell wall biosynthesis
MRGAQSYIKGFDLLQAALGHLRNNRSDLQLAIFGQSAPDKPKDLGFPVHYLGHIHDDLTLRILYSAADVMVIPSRQDNLPNTGVESLACGTPVVAFDTCGLPDIVSHMKTGYLARPFDTEDLAMGIEWVLADSSRYGVLSKNARAYSVDHFSEAVVVSRYLELYEEANAGRSIRHGNFF